MAGELASAGGYEAVHMREVAKLAEISLSTLYRYYPSKDYLIKDVVRDELVRLRSDIISRFPTQRSPHERAANVLVRAFRGVRRDGERGFAHAAMSVDRMPLSLDAPYTRHLGIDLMDIMKLAAWGEEHRISKTQYQALDMLQALWSSNVVAWLDGGLSIADVDDRLRVAARRLIEPVSDSPPILNADKANRPVSS
ncbi:TetR/AcrR family transcriptional regulator [Rhodococcus sp. KBS0724]|uniref:TetR family transcriptional regulator n=1 Tax=Rhodococcus sp. KBS0724 TaxID=1179674 RepID=UPI00163D54FA|nr:TetR/AcrR family transcriptional regulator [Rhodococcus sp. KBS0724]